MSATDDCISEYTLHEHFPLFDEQQQEDFFRGRIRGSCCQSDSTAVVFVYFSRFRQREK